jgi:hypothetical protein
MTGDTTRGGLTPSFADPLIRQTRRRRRVLTQTGSKVSPSGKRPKKTSRRSARSARADRRSASLAATACSTWASVLCSASGVRRASPRTARGDRHRGTRREAQGRKPAMNGPGKSDSLVVPGKSPNKAGQPAAEGMEGKGLAEGNLHQQNAPWAQNRDGAPSALERVRQVARRDRKLQFTTLLHHVYNPAALRSAYFALKRDASPGVDGDAALRRGAGEQSPRPLRTAPRPGRSTTAMAWISRTTSTGAPATPLGLPTRRARCDVPRRLLGSAGAFALAVGAMPSHLNLFGVGSRCCAGK